MSNRTSEGYLASRGLGIVGTLATGQGSTDTSVIRFVAANITQTTTSGANGYAVVETAVLGTQVSINRPGIYSISLNAALAIAGVLTAGISLGGTLAPFVAEPVDFGAATAAYVSIGGDPTLATAHPLINVAATVQISRAMIDGVQNVVRFGATVGVTLDGANSRFEIQRIGDMPDAG